jgi:hypothetical protein
VRAVFDLGGTTVEFTRKTDTDGPYPYLTRVGTLRVAARAGRQAGLGVGESPSLDISLDNNERQTAAILGNPLRAPVTVYEDDGDIFFAGAISRIQFGRVIVVTLGN